VVKYLSEPDGVELHTAAGGRVRARKAVFATGYETPEFLERSLVRLLSTYAFATEPLGHAEGWGEDRCLIWETSRPYFYARTTPDGRAIVFVRSVEETGGGSADDLYSVRPSGAALARLTRTSRIDEFDPRYFAGGILFSRGESGEEASAYADIYTMRRDGRKVRSLVAGAGSAYVEDVTPDGHLLLFRRDQGLWVKRIGPGKARKLSNLPDGSRTNAVFSSDGAQVAAFIEDEGREQLSSISVRSGASSELAEGFEPTKPTGSGTTSTIGPVITWQPSR